MFQWASDHFDKLTETLAPPPTDAAGRFGYAVTKLDENTAMGCIAEFDPVQTVVNQSKGWFPIHMACQYNMIRLIRFLMNQPGASIQQPDYAGFTPLHHACMSTQRATGLEVVKMLLNEYSADPCAKNSRGETPYDIATLDSIRQYLLPIQLQRETQYALDNGGVGLVPGIDLGGLKIKRTNMAPPPQFGGAGVASAPPGGAAPPMTSTPGQSRYPQTPGMTPGFGSPMATAGGATASSTQQLISSPQALARAPASMPGRSSIANNPRSKSADGTSKYSRSGGSSLAVYSKYKADGFHSSSSDVGLQQKYGHVGVNNSSGTPPPSSGNAPSSGNSITAGPNPFSGAGNLGGVGVARYASYGQTAAPAPVSGPMYSGYSYPAATDAAPKYFTPGATAAAAPTPSTSAAPTSPFMPPPPYSGTKVAETNAMAPSPAVTSSAPSVNSPFVAPKSDGSAPAAVANLFESPPKTEPDSAPITQETDSETKEEPAPASDNVGEEDSGSDWVETVDPTSGKTYYFNSKTNETSWDKPNETTAAEETPGAATEQVVNGESDWVKTVDPTSGQSYYYNSKTGETSWEKPSGATVEDANNATATADNEPSQDSEWEEVVDPSSGQTYYYNSATGETSWDHPSTLDSNENFSPPDSATPPEADTTDGVVQDDAPVGEKEENVEDESSPDAVADTPPITEETDDLVEKEKEGEGAETLTETKAEDDTPAESADAKPESTTEAETTTETKAVEGGSDALPDGWTEATDPSSGKSYYFNASTQETSWERPVAENGAADEGESKLAEVTEESKVVQDLADGWEEVDDPSSGKKYYFNRETQETSWEKPTSTSSGAATTNDAASPSEHENDWAEILDPKSGKTYYYNAKTGETSWEKPASLVVQEETTANETQTTDANIAESKPTSAEDTFAQPAVDTAIAPGETSEDKPQETPLAMGHQRTLSAQEMFASPPGVSQSSQTSGPSAKFGRPDFISPAAATQGSAVSPGALSTPGGMTATAEDLFAFNATAAPSKTAEDLFGLTNLDAPPDTIPEPNDTSPNDNTASEPFSVVDTDDGDMTDIPLTPATEPMVKTGESLPTIPTTAPAPAVNDDLFAAIGMPPPPFQSRR